MEIEELREKIDKIDNELTILFNERMKLCGKIAEYKASHKLPVSNDQRECEILEKVSAASAEEFAGYSRELFAKIFELSRSYQSSLISR